MSCEPQVARPGSKRAGKLANKGFRPSVDSDVVRNSHDAVTAIAFYTDDLIRDELDDTFGDLMEALGGSPDIIVARENFDVVYVKSLNWAGGYWSAGTGMMVFISNKLGMFVHEYGHDMGLVLTNVPNAIQCGVGRVLVREEHGREVNDTQRTVLL